jgi:mRNA interferase MazF
MAYPRKGEIYLVNFDPTIGHEVKKKRPALIISNDIHNQYSPLVTVAPLSSNIDKRRLLNKIGVIEDKEILSQVDGVIREHFGL